MLQQTQVDRVLPKYQAFVKRFPTLRSLAAAPLGDVLRMWQGLGYNRRAKALHQTAQTVVRERNGTFPKTVEELETLPGIGPYTARAVCAFAYNMPVAMVETNIRTVLFHHLLPNKEVISDSELTVLAECVLVIQNSREWHWALMDYGAYLKKLGVRTNAQSKHYTKQSKFKGSTRELRGALVRALTDGAKSTLTLTRLCTRPEVEVEQQLQNLQKDGLVIRTGTRWCVA
jgi:A/G-specific adenine glycosylase